MTEPVKKIAPKLTPDRFKQAEYTRNIFAMTPAPNTEVEHLIKPEYWSHVAKMMNPTDRVEVVAEDNSWFAEVLIMSTGPNWARVKLLRHVSLVEKATKADAPIAENPQFEVNYGGVSAKHRVVRLSDKSVIKDGFATKAEAVKYMQDYELSSLTA